jgi:hypothetical protein
MPTFLESCIAQTQQRSLAALLINEPGASRGDPLPKHGQPPNRQHRYDGENRNEHRHPGPVLSSPDTPVDSR